MHDAECSREFSRHSQTNISASQCVLQYCKYCNSDPFECHRYSSIADDAVSADSETGPLAFSTGLIGPMANFPLKPENR